MHKGKLRRKYNIQHNNHSHVKSILIGAIKCKLYKNSNKRICTCGRVFWLTFELKILSTFIILNLTGITIFTFLRNLFKVKFLCYITITFKINLQDKLLSFCLTNSHGGKLLNLTTKHFHARSKFHSG